MKQVSFITNTTDRLGSHRYRIATPVSLLSKQQGIIAKIKSWPDGSEDVAIFSKHFQFLDYQYAKFVHATGGRVIIDICDNHTGDTRLGGHYIRMVQEADAVTYATEELRRIVQPIMEEKGARCESFVVGDPPIHSSKGAKRSVPASHPNMLWYGQAPSLVALRECLPSLPQGNLVVICDRFPEWLSEYKGHIVPVEWAASDLVKYVTESDIVLLPQTLDDKARCKSNNRLVEAVNLGRPVAASPIPAYQEFSDCMFIGEHIGAEVEKFLRCTLDDVHRRIDKAQARVNQLYGQAVVASQWMRAIEYVEYA